MKSLKETITNVWANYKVWRKRNHGWFIGLYVIIFIWFFFTIMIWLTDQDDTHVTLVHLLKEQWDGIVKGAHWVARLRHRIY